MTSKEIVEEAVAAILKDDRAYCECRRSPFDGHNVNPPCATRTKITEQVRLTLEIAERHNRTENPLPSLPLPPAEPPVQTKWAIFGVNSPYDAAPISPARFSSREAADTYIKAHYPSPEWLQVRGRTANGWA